MSQETELPTCQQDSEFDVRYRRYKEGATALARHYRETCRSLKVEPDAWASSMLDDWAAQRTHLLRPRSPPLPSEDHAERQARVAVVENLREKAIGLGVEAPEHMRDRLADWMRAMR